MASRCHCDAMRWSPVHQPRTGLSSTRSGRRRLAYDELLLLQRGRESRRAVERAARARPVADGRRSSATSPASRSPSPARRSGRPPRSSRSGRTVPDAPAAAGRRRLGQDRWWRPYALLPGGQAGRQAAFMAPTEIARRAAPRATCAALLAPRWACASWACTTARPRAERQRGAALAIAGEVDIAGRHPRADSGGRRVPRARRGRDRRAAPLRRRAARRAAREGAARRRPTCW